MADATRDQIWETRPRSGRNTYKIANSITPFVGMFAQLVRTGGTEGYLDHWDEAGTWLGLVLRGDENDDGSLKTGDTSASIPPEATVDESGVILKGVTIGGTPTQAKVGELVYCADSDPSNLTFTDTTAAPVGICVRYTSATSQDVQLFTPAEAIAGTASW